MRKLALFVSVCLVASSCSKEENLTKHDTFKDIVYRIQTSDTLHVNLMRSVYNEQVKGNIGKDTLIAHPGTHLISATVLTGVQVTLFGMSSKNADFDLKIIGDNNTVLAETDSITHYPANELHGDQYISRISFTP